MSATVQETAVRTSQLPSQIQRPARALIGWMTPEEACLTLAGRRGDHSGQPEFAEQSARTQDAVARRAPGIDQSDTVMPLPEVLAEYVESLRQHPGAGSYFADRWNVALVDLRKVCALQPCVFVDHAEARVGPIDPDDLPGLASVSLPLPGATQLPAQFDEQRQAWIVSAPNPNLRIVGRFANQVQPGVAVFGFAVSVSASFLQVARFRDRFLLRDGYHRAHGFLRRGIHVVPAFVREYGPFEDLGLPVGLLPQGAYMGDRPPLLPDYFDDAVSADVQLPAFQKMIVVHGLEFTPME